ncbi:hypothetical protein A2U01_0052566, partial [Trifolium medium]|nr:hypothetical protein [Trifolium medium]
MDLSRGNKKGVSCDGGGDEDVNDDWPKRHRLQENNR